MSRKSPKVSFIDERLCFALYSTSKTVISKYQPFLAKLDMTYPQYLVYIALAEHDRLNVNELGALLNLDSGTLTPLLKRMEANGLLTRKRSDEDERRVYIELTAKALDLDLKIADMQKQVSCSIGLETEEFVALRDQLKSINTHLRRS